MLVLLKTDKKECRTFKKIFPVYEQGNIRPDQTNVEIVLEIQGFKHFQLTPVSFKDDMVFIFINDVKFACLKHYKERY